MTSPDDPTEIQPECPICLKAQEDWHVCWKCHGVMCRALELVSPAQHELKVAPEERIAITRNRAEFIPYWPAGTFGGHMGGGHWEGIEAELTTSLVRQGQRGSGGRGGSGNPLPFDQGASDALAYLRNNLATWIRELCVLGDWPADNLRAMAKWLLDRSLMIRTHEVGGQIAWDIIDAMDKARMVIDSRTVKVFAGRCLICNKGDLYGIPGRDTAICGQCKAVAVGIKDHRASMVELALDTWHPKKAILEALPDVYGVEVSDARFRKWIQRRKLISRGTIVIDRNRANLLHDYRVGDVVDLALAVRRKASLAKSIEGFISVQAMRERFNRMNESFRPRR